MNTVFMQAFAEHRFARKARVSVGQSNASGHMCLDMPSPAAVAAFIAFVKYHAAKRFGPDTDVFIRGQREDCSDVAPALYRSGDNRVRQQRRAAYLDLIERLPKELALTRFSRDNAGSILQHYGLYTPWLDLVDNLYTALWFALHKPESKPSGKLGYVRRTHGTGWILLLASRKSDTEAVVADLRRTQESLSVRLHVQHGISMSTASDGSDVAASWSLEPFVVGRLRFEIGPHWRLAGPLSHVSFMFPRQTIDHTYKALRGKRVSAMIQNVETKYGVTGELGAVNVYAYR